MNHTRLRVVATIIGGFILISFILSVPHAREISPVAVPESIATSTPAVALRDAFRRGVHSITGSVEAPDPCTVVSAQAVPVGDASSTTGILIEVTLPEDSGVCLQVPSPLSFSATITAPEGLPMSATVNGVAASTTVL